MDLICCICAEPIGVDELHDIDSGDGVTLPFGRALALFQTQGCGALWGKPCAPATDPTSRERAAMAEALYELLGDDVDGAACMLEDLGW